MVVRQKMGRISKIGLNNIPVHLIFIHRMFGIGCITIFTHFYLHIGLCLCVIQSKNNAFYLGAFLLLHPHPPLAAFFADEAFAFLAGAFLPLPPNKETLGIRGMSEAYSEIA
jgi:hypothetical protein